MNQVVTLEPCKCMYSKEQLIEIAQESAEYFLNIFTEDGVDISQIACMITRCCMERCEVYAFLELRKYCRSMEHTIPVHYNDIATNGDAFDFYLRQLLYYMIEQSQ